MSGLTQALVTGTVAIAAQQLLARLLPFYLHASAKAQMTPEDASVGSVKFQLALAVAYSLSREGFRRGCLRGRSSGVVVRAAWAVLPVWVSAATIATVVMGAHTPRTAGGEAQPSFRYAMGVLWLSLVLEGLAEPFFILGTFTGKFTVEATIEVLARVAEAIALWSSLYVAQINAPPALAFARGQLAYAITYAVLYYLFGLRWQAQALKGDRPPQSTLSSDPQMASDGTDTARSNAEPDGCCGGQSCAVPGMVRWYASRFGADQDVVWSSFVFTWQAAQKMLLQEASRIALTGYSAHVAGVYGEVQNLGSLVVRLVFWPVESAAFRAFSRFRDASGPDAAPTRTASARAYSASSLDALVRLTRLVTLVALLAVAFGPNYSFTAIHVLLSRTWSATEAPRVLSLYSVYLLFLAVNGVTEAFTHAHMSSRDLGRANVFMVATALCHAAAICVAGRVAPGCDALVYLDCASMLARIAYSFSIIIARCQRRGRLLHMLPSAASCAALAAAFAVTRSSAVAMRSALGPTDLESRVPAPMLRHIGVGASTLLLLTGGLFYFERHRLRDMRAALKAKTN